jgi:hypothetical protein
MGIQMMIQKASAVVGGFGMTLHTGHRSFGHGYGRTPARNLVVPCFMTFGAVKIIAAHVNITVPIRFKKLPGHIGMFDGIPATAIKMTGTATGTAGVTDVLSHPFQIHLFDRETCSRRWRVFLIGSGCIMAHQAIHSGFVCKIKGRIFPAVSCMTGCATSLVADGADSEIVQGRGTLAMHDVLSMSGGIR